MKKINKNTLVIIVSIIIVVVSGCFLLFKRNNSINLELIEDINSIRDKGQIVNAKQKEPYTIPLTYYGKGYYITVSMGGDCTDYFIYSSDNDKEIWHYTKIYRLEEKN